MADSHPETHRASDRNTTLSQLLRNSEYTTFLSLLRLNYKIVLDVEEHLGLACLLEIEV